MHNSNVDQFIPSDPVSLHIPIFICLFIIFHFVEWLCNDIKHFGVSRKSDIVVHWFLTLKSLMHFSQYLTCLLF